MENLSPQIKEAFEREIELVRQDLIARHKELKMKASGKWIKSLNTIIDYTANVLSSDFVNLNYTEQLVQGRAPGKFPPIQSIKDWIIAKPITPSDNISIDSLAFLIARKIATVGTKIYQEGGTDLIESVINPERIKKIVENLGTIFLSNFRLEVNELLIRP